MARTAPFAITSPSKTTLIFYPNVPPSPFSTPFNVIVFMPFPFAPPEQFADPRQEPGFRPNDWPLCDGKEAPAWESSDLHQRRCVEFLAAFYRMNVLQTDLLEAHRAEERETARAILANLQLATRALEALEDHYAPIGFFGDPVMDGLRYHDIRFIRPSPPSIYPANSSVSACIAIPGLDEIPESEREGPVRFWKWNHGKVDL
jgi:hypothetical protein